jgi:hypothetical protein
MFFIMTFADAPKFFLALGTRSAQLEQLGGVSAGFWKSGPGPKMALQNIAHEALTVSPAGFWNPGPSPKMALQNIVHEVAKHNRGCLSITYFAVCPQTRVTSPHV